MPGKLYKLYKDSEYRRRFHVSIALTEEEVEAYRAYLKRRHSEWNINDLLRSALSEGLANLHERMDEEEEEENEEA